jgi:hypothetical protein
MNMHAIALPLTVADIIDEYQAKVADVDAAIARFEQAHTDMTAACCVQGIYAETVVKDPFVRASSVLMNLRKSGWKAVYRRLSIDDLASANDKRLFEQTLADPPDLTLDNAKATFGDYLLRPRFHKLRALAECFTSLDPAYKSHSKVKIGVAGLPKRVILSNVSGYGSWGRGRVRDILNALAAVQDLPMVEHDELAGLDRLHSYLTAKSGEVEFAARGVTVRKFQNGNGHVIFNPSTLLAINRALAEFYGEVLPDMEEETPRQPGSAVSADLQYYPTPARVVRIVLDEIGLYSKRDQWHTSWSAKRVLEPSCGDGLIMDEIAARGHRCLGVEVHAGRAQQARDKGHNVMSGNFLDAAPNPIFDCVVMNPPFSGKHWRKHLAHALKCLAPGGVLACILPASAEYDHEVSKEFDGRWHDLPVASFAESGTNVPTGFIVIRRDDA